MELRDLHCFCALAKELHFAKAARTSNMSPSALTRVIQKIETSLGKQLFFRDKRTVALTESGQIFLDYAERALADFERCRAQLISSDSILRGELSIFCSVTAVYAILGTVLEPFKQQYPEITINLSTGDASDALNRVLDRKTMISIGPKPEILPNGITFEEIASPRIVCIGSVNHSVFPIMGPEKTVLWRDTPIIVPETGELRNAVDKWFNSLGDQQNIFTQVSGHEAIIAMVSMGFGVGFVPELVIQKSPMRDSLKIVSTKALPNYPVGILYNSKRATDPLVQAFCTVVKSAYGLPQD